MRRTLACLSTLLALATAAFAGEAISLSKPYGNKDGCTNKVQQEFYSETMLLLTDTAFTTATGYCEIKSTAVNADGSLSLKASCQAEGEEEATDTVLTVSRVAGSSSHVSVADQDGGVYGELAPCP